MGGSFRRSLKSPHSLRPIAPYRAARANLETRSKNGWTSLMFAADYNKSEVVPSARTPLRLY